MTTPPPLSEPPSEAPKASDRTRIAVPPTGNPGEETRISDALPQSEFTRVVAPGVMINENYRILRLVSAGGMGEVYRGENIFTGDPVAVKIILPNLARDESIIDLFRREARVLVQMRDDAIVRYHNFIRDRGLNRYCLIMEYVEGEHLWDYVQQYGPLGVDAARILLRRLAHGLAEAHARGVTHRDLSPDNVILRDNRLDEAVLIDFGIARSTDFGDGLHGRFAGKFKYIAPEQLGHYQGQIGPATDVYGLALMIAAALRGEPLEMGSSIVEATDARRKIPDLSRFSHEIYPLLQHMLEPDPQHRPRDMAAVLAILDDPTHLPARYRLPLWENAGQSEITDRLLLEPSDASSASPFSELSSQPAAPLPANHSGKGGAALIAALAGGLLLAAGGGWFLTRPAPEIAAPPPTEVSSLPDLPPRDSASRDGFLAEQPLGDCTFATRLANGPDAGKLRVIADHAGDYRALQDGYAAKFSTRPALITAEATLAQCPALDFARSLSGRAAAPPVLSLDAMEVTSGTEVSGRIRDLSGRKLWLFLVSPKGGVYDLSRLATGQADGSFTFEFGISLAAGEAGPEPQILVALASDEALSSVAAAPSGSDAARLLPLALEEIQRQGGMSAAALVPFTVNPAPPPAEDGVAPDTEEPEPKP